MVEERRNEGAFSSTPPPREPDEDYPLPLALEPHSTLPVLALVGIVVAVLCVEIVALVVGANLGWEFGVAALFLLLAAVAGASVALLHFSLEMSWGIASLRVGFTYYSILLCEGVLGGAAAAGVWPAFFLLAFLLIFYGWMLGAYLHYRRGRQDELVHVIITALEAQAPLVSALRSYARDRPGGPLRQAWAFFLLFFVLPGYYFLWHFWDSFDRKVERVAHALYEGATLHEALLSVPGAVSREALLAVAVGQQTGQLTAALNRVANRETRGLWMEMIPRLLYPIILVLFITGIMGFWMVFLLPKMQRIYRDFGMTLPDVTSAVASWWPVASVTTWGLLVSIIVLLLLAVSHSTARWYVPLVRLFYRLDVQGRLLQMLSILLDTGKPAPEALALLTDSGYFPPVVADRLTEARLAVERGEPLGPSLSERGLLPARMVPLVQAAERLRNLPAMLAELGESLIARAIRFLRRVSLVVTPVTILLVAAAVAIFALCMFLPLIKLLESLADAPPA